MEELFKDVEFAQFILKKYFFSNMTDEEKPLKRDKKQKQCKRRAAIEPIIGHLKSDFRLSRNFLKGIIGDEINVLMAATEWNLRQWIIAFLCLGFILYYHLFLTQVYGLFP